MHEDYLKCRSENRRLKSSRKEFGLVRILLALEIFSQNLSTGTGERKERKNKANRLAWSVRNTAAAIFPVNPMLGAVIFKNNDKST